MTNNQRDDRKIAGLCMSVSFAVNYDKPDEQWYEIYNKGAIVALRRYNRTNPSNRDGVEYLKSMGFIFVPEGNFLTCR